MQGATLSLPRYRVGDNVKPLFSVNAWDSEVTPPHPEEEFLIPVRVDSIFIFPFLLKSELLPDIVAIFECTKRTESGMRNFPDNRPPDIGK